MDPQFVETYRKVRRDNVDARNAFRIADAWTKETGPRAMLQDLKWVADPRSDERRATLIMGDYKVTFEQAQDLDIPQEDVLVYTDPKLVTDWDHVLKVGVNSRTFGSPLAYVVLSVTYEDIYDHFHKYSGYSKGAADSEARIRLFEEARRAVQFGESWWYTHISATVTHAKLGIELGSDSLTGIPSDTDDENLLDVLETVFEEALDAADAKMEELRREICK